MFRLDPILENDSRPLLEDADVCLRLMDDARFPWLLIVPKVENAIELHDLDEAAYLALMRRARDAGRALQRAFSADKINTAALGNAVRQLHVHVIARTRGDAAWPGPVWGKGAPEALSEAQARAWISLISEELNLR